MQFKFTTLIPLILGCIMGIAFTNLFKSCNDKPTFITPTVKATTLEKQVQKTEQDITTKETNLQKRQEKIQQELVQTKTALSKAKERNKELQTQVLDLLDQQSLAITNVDTSTTLQFSEPFASIVTDFIDNTNTRDSLCDANILQLQEQVSNKDSTLQLQQEKYAQLKSAFNQSIQQQSLQEQETKFYKKKFKLQKVKNKLISTATLILGGFITKNLILNH
jgi:hypothetical protein